MYKCSIYVHVVELLQRNKPLEPVTGQLCRINKLFQEGRVLQNNFGVFRRSLMYIEKYNATKKEEQGSGKTFLLTNFLM